MTDEELAAATSAELIARRHCLKLGEPFDRDRWLEVRSEVDRLLDMMMESNAKAHDAVAKHNRSTRANGGSDAG